MTKDEARALLAVVTLKDKLLLSKKPFAGLWGGGVEQQKSGPKPQGLWYACGGEWIEWMLSEMPEWLRSYKYVYTLDLDYSQMLKIRTLGQLEAFEKRYLSMFEDRDLQGYKIDWREVAEEYGGIEICPYQWEARMEKLWYYGWDVASGCIWDTRLIQGITQVI